jgi:predicted PhzF superfamily epimerase YddE/YHI9
MAHRHRRRTTYRVSQGARVGRAGTVEITADPEDPDGTVWVGGAATVCIRGTITL